MLWCHPTGLDSDGFWQSIPPRFAAAVGCDLQIGRRMYTLLSDLGMNDIAVDYLTVDTLRVPRETFARIWEAWRDGYADELASKSGPPRDSVWATWNRMIDCIRDPLGYAVWQLPVLSAVVP